MAAHLQGGSNEGHSDYLQINDTQSLGIKHKDLATLFTDVECGIDPRAPGNIHAGNCAGHALEAISAWYSGGWWDPRGGTEFIPPTGDHHRAGWRMMLQPTFSAGDWLTGFASLSPSFPFYPNPDLGPGAGESPILIYEECLEENSLSDADGLGEGADVEPCKSIAAQAGLQIIQFLDNHGEPLTPGRFPRYVPHERQAWVGTVVSKYTASSDVGITNIDADLDNDPDDLEGGKINQLFTSMHKIISDRSVTWFSMSDQSGNGCSGGWCQWLWDPGAAAADDQLTMVNRPPDNPYWVQTDPDADFETSGIATPTQVTSFTVLNEVNGMFFTRDLSTIEKAPSEIYQVVGQFLQLGTGQAFGVEDAGAAGAGFPQGVPSQNLWSEFWGISGPNVQAHESVNPYTWFICGAAGNDAHVDCGGSTGPNDAPIFGAVRRTMAITQFGLNPANRFGGDMTPGNDPSTDFGNIDADGDGTVNEADDTDGDCADGAEGGAGSDCDRGFRTAMVACTPTGDTDNDPRTSACLSAPAGGDGIYGNGGTDLIYYREIVEEGLRGGGLRHDRVIGFSFLNRLGENTGTLVPEPFSVAAGSGLENTLRQLVTDQQQGFLLSCLNCENDRSHMLPVHEVSYNFTFNQTVPGFFGSHGSNVGGTLTFSGGQLQNP
jgi:hypothetical protein